MYLLQYDEYTPNSNKPGSNGFHFSILSLDSHILKIVFHFKRQIENHSGKQLTCILIQIERGVLLTKMWDWKEAEAIQNHLPLIRLFATTNELSLKFYSIFK